jgi:hypothetical protein
LRFGIVVGFVLGFVVGFVLGVGVVGVWGVEVVVVGVDGGADGFAPGAGAEGVDVFVLGQAGGLEESLEHVGYGAGDAGLDFAADYGGDETAEGGV